MNSRDVKNKCILWLTQKNAILIKRSVIHYSCFQKSEIKELFSLATINTLKKVPLFIQFLLFEAKKQVFKVIESLLIIQNKPSMNCNVLCVSMSFSLNFSGVVKNYVDVALISLECKTIWKIHQLQLLNSCNI